MNNNLNLVKSKLSKFSLILIINSAVLLGILFILACFGVRWVGADEIALLDKILENQILYNMFVFITMFLSFYMVFRVTCNKNKTRLVLIISSIPTAYKIPVFLFGIYQYGFLFDIVYMVVVTLILKGRITRLFIMLLILGSIQLMLSFIKGVWLKDIMNNHLSLHLILNIDFLILGYNISSLMKGGKNKCGVVFYSGESLAGSTQSLDSSLALSRCHITPSKDSFKKLKLQEPKAKQLSKKEKFQKLKKNLSLLNIFYFILYLAWNVFTFRIVYMFANFNNKILEMSIVVLVFIVNKKMFGRPLHLSASVCFIVSVIVFFVISKALPFSSLSIILPIMVGLSMALISSVIQEIFMEIKEEKKLSLRAKIKKKLNKDDPTLEDIEAACKSKDYTDDKVKEIALTVYTYLHETLDVTANKLYCDPKTVTRRINDFLKD